jgi:hypothetical protein
MTRVLPKRGRRTAALVATIAVAQLTIPATAQQAGPGPSLRPDGPPAVGALHVLSGSLHDHTTDSDGDTSSPEVTAWLSQHHQQLGVDFVSLSEHSDAFPNALNSPTTPDPWSRQAALDQQYSRDGFSLMRGFELTNDQENHLNVIGSSNWTTRGASGEGTFRMDPFYQWLGTAPVLDPTGRGLGFGGADGVGQFNHPGDKGALNWDDYAFNPAVAAQMSTIEIFGNQGRSPAGLSSSDAGWYWFALSQGWTVSPVMDWDWHPWTGKGIVTNPTPGKDCGVDGFLPCQRTMVVADSSTPANILDALHHRRTTASELPDLWATLRGPDGSWQGSTVAAAPGSTLTLTVDAGSASQGLQSVDIVSDAGVSPYPYYYGDNAPCDVNWPPNPGDPTQSCQPSNVSHAQLTPSYVEQHRRFVASGGHATRKARIDQPPPGTVLASVPLSGHRDTVTITITVPSTPSIRPDGKHFFYAIVHADAPVADADASGVTARAWTGPILSTPPSDGRA